MCPSSLLLHLYMGWRCARFTFPNFVPTTNASPSSYFDHIMAVLLPFNEEDTLWSDDVKPPIMGSRAALYTPHYGLDTSI
jgi:hypothetical protein